MSCLTSSFREHRCGDHHKNYQQNSASAAVCQVDTQVLNCLQASACRLPVRRAWAYDVTIQMYHPLRSWHVLLSRRFQEHLAATASVPATDAATQVLARADETMGFHNQCGLTRADTTKCQYTPDGRLWETNKYGVYEVSSHAGVAPHPAVAMHDVTSLQDLACSPDQSAWSQSLQLVHNMVLLFVA